MIKNIIILFIAFLSVTDLFSQEKPFWNDIQKFKESDRFNPPVQKAIVFIGSSSFAMWHDVQDYFPGYTIINRSFGGSTLPDVTGYLNDIVFPYHPKQVVIYCGDNDLANSDTITANEVLQRFKLLFQKIRKQLPSISIVYVSIKPSPSRKHLMTKAAQANIMIQKYLKTQKNTSFVDVYHKMLNKNGSIRSDIFLQDELHMNAKGYAIWKQAILPYLKK
ncbi:GDSL-type esterase/lipase family protein [Chitinophagaceae bacterium LB-8]|uniref:GDSL-type esterase/lipase family protein n=1 Tax=Paraflavisolibacter caeni TaxID=2982496 RepID=A0A9X2XY17_9BACT|nr:GDSL-type esterase/lipase family protein [Paraflavisolibacter caeni]MCU7551501.1 GDSL-type esterase/lipase family protein [Paraflavisolibacter caeni]